MGTYEAKGREVWKKPVRRPYDGGTEIEIGFPVCTMHDACSEQAETVAAMLNLADETSRARVGHHKLDTDRQVFFYEQEFYVLSNFSAFNLRWRCFTFDTVEAAYHWEKFPDFLSLQHRILLAPSAHEAFRIAQAEKVCRRHDWDEVKVDILRELLRAKAEQHEYVRRKLLETGERELIEDSWRDDFWGWGPNRDGKNMLGKLWMEVRAELRSLGVTRDSITGAPAPGDGR